MPEESPVQPDKSRFDELLQFLKSVDPEDGLVVFISTDKKSKPFYLKIEQSSKDNSGRP